MDTITKYASIGLGAICTLLIIYCLLLRNDRDNALNKIDSLNGQLDVAVTANLSLQSTVSAYKRQQEAAHKYITNLEISKQETDNKYRREIERFRHVKNSNETINTWANTKLPDGLCQ